MAGTVRLHAFIHGYVQGVNFRWYTRRKAAQLGLTGYVRNCWDGSVEVVAEGEEREVQELLVWLYKGPPLAQVEHVDISWETPTGQFSSFEVRH